MSVTFSKLGSMGRLGNQLWQIASTIGIALKNGQYANFPKWQYEKYFINHLPETECIDKIIKEKNFSYDEYVLQELYNYDLYGYFQSWKYFHHCKQIIKEQFTFNSAFAEETKQKFNHFDKTTIAIHIRRGDYVGHQAHPTLSVKYYLKAIEQIQDWQNCNLLFFSDDQPYCRWNYGCLPNAYFSECNEIEDLYLMTQCTHFIIANSSLGWWGAYLGEKKGSIVIRPKVQFSGTLLRHDIKDLYPENWLPFDEEKLDLKNTTFIIPVHYDHRDREENLKLAIQTIQRDFETHIHVIEQGGSKFYRLFGFKATYSEYGNQNHNNFHRTAMINIIAKHAETKFIVNYDADILISPVQIWYSVQLLKDMADIVYPYNGIFNHIERSLIPKLQENLDALITQNFHFNKESFGGAVFMNKKSFFSAGGENEKFIAFGPEDAERYNRFLKVGLTVLRVNGQIYHLDHFRGPNSSKNSRFIRPNRAEWRKVEAMTKEELLTYVKTWESWQK